MADDALDSRLRAAAVEEAAEAAAEARRRAEANAPVFAAIVGGTLRTMNVQPDTALESAVVAAGGGSR